MKGTTNITCDIDDCSIRMIPHSTIGISYNIPFHRSQIGPAATVLVDLDGNLLYEGDRGESYDSYTLTLYPMGYSEDEDEEDELASMEKRIKENAIVTDEQIKNMESFGSAAMTDPDLLTKQIEAHSRKDRDAGADKTKKNKARKSDDSLPSLDGLQEFINPDGMGRYTFVVRKYNLGHTKRRVSTLVKRIDAYRKGHRKKLSIRENRNIIWQGIMGMIFGVFSFLLSLLLGQYSEPRYGGSPRRRMEQSNPSFSGPNTMSSNTVKMSSVSSRSRSSYSSTSYGKRPKSYGGYSGQRGY